MPLEALRKIWRALESNLKNPKSRYIETILRFVPSKSATDPLGVTATDVTGNLIRKFICDTRNVRGRSEEVSYCDHPF